MHDFRLAVANFSKGTCPYKKQSFPSGADGRLDANSLKCHEIEQIYYDNYVNLSTKMKSSCCKMKKAFLPNKGLTSPHIWIMPFLYTVISR